jgi:ABC-type branched-subunit amino acid transport system permease subunit
LGAWRAFSVDFSFKLLFMVIIGGMGSIAGGFLGAGIHHRVAHRLDPLLASGSLTCLVLKCPPPFLRTPS